jgi:hypothetical protein
MYMLLCTVKSVQYTLLDVGLVSTAIHPQPTSIVMFLKPFVLIARFRMLQ